MKKLFLQSLSLFLTVCLFAQDSTYFSVLWTPKDLYKKAGVKQEGVFLYFYKNDAIYDSALLQIKLYDSQGRVTRQHDYKSNKIRVKYAHFYSGNLLDSTVEEQVWIPATIVHRYQYDDAGRLLITTTYNGREKTTQSRYVYNSLGQPSDFYVEMGGKELLARKYTYQPDNNLIKQIDYFFSKDENEENFSYLYTYEDNNKKTTRIIQRDRGRKRTVDCIRTYNEQQQLLKQIRFSPNHPKTKAPKANATEIELEELSIYLPYGLLDKREFRANGTLTQLEKHFYN